MRTEAGRTLQAVTAAMHLQLLVVSGPHRRAQPDDTLLLRRLGVPQARQVTRHRVREHLARAQAASRTGQTPAFGMYTASGRVVSRMPDCAAYQCESWCDGQACTGEHWYMCMRTMSATSSRETDLPASRAQQYKWCALCCCTSLSSCSVGIPPAASAGTTTAR